MEIKKILLVEDTAEANLIINAILGDRYELRAVTNASLAIRELYKNNYSLILLDIGLPDTDGFKMFSIIKNTPNFKDIPVIFITGRTDPKEKEKGLAMGARDYIIKPFDPLDAKQRIEKVLQESKPTK